MRVIGFAAAALVIAFMSVCSRVPPSGDKPVVDLGKTQSAVLGPRLWSQRFGNPDYQFGRAIAVDSDGNVLVAGEFYGTVNFGCGDLNSPGGSIFPDIYVAKLTSSGACLWSLQFNDSAAGYAHGVAVDSGKNVYVVGDFFGTVSLPDACGQMTSGGNTDIVLSKFGEGGNCIWAKHFGDGSSSFGDSIAVDSSDAVIIGGDFSGLLNFGGGDSLHSRGGQDVYLAKFDTDGNYQWARSFGVNANQFCGGVAVDASGNIVVTGSFNGRVNFGDLDLTSSPTGLDIFLAKFGPGGDHLHSRRFGDGQDKFAKAVAFDGDGNVFLAGHFRGSLYFGGYDTLEAAIAGYDIFLAKFDRDLANIWAKQFGDPADQFAAAVATDAWGNSYVTGHYFGYVNFGDRTLRWALPPSDGTEGKAGGYLAKFSSAGVCFGSKDFGEPDNQYGEAVAFDRDGNVFMAGQFSGAAMDLGGQALQNAGPGQADIFVGKLDRACDATNCTGCCDGLTCRTPTVSQCGAGGAVCAACDTRVADNCGNGSCRCGTGPGPCASGQRCIDGTCICDGDTCPNGCCNGGRLGGTCQTRTRDFCAPVGQSCQRCSSTLASACRSDGSCGCGTGAVCNAFTADNCTDGLCRCGTGSECSGSAADRCTNGTCTCGTGPACSGDSHCSSGQCVCNQCGAYPGDCHACPPPSCADSGQCGTYPDDCHPCCGGLMVWCPRCERCAASCAGCEPFGPSF